MIHNRSGGRSVLDQVATTRGRAGGAPPVAGRPVAGPPAALGPAARWTGPAPAALPALRALDLLRGGGSIAEARPLLLALVEAGAGTAPGPADATAPAEPAPDPADAADLALLRAALDAPGALPVAEREALEGALGRVAARRGAAVARGDGRELAGFGGDWARRGAGIGAIVGVLGGLWLLWGWVLGG